MPFRRTSIDSNQKTGFYLPKLSRVVGSRLLSSPLPAIGDAFEGGFFAGLISHTADGVATHALIVAPRGAGTTGSAYPTGSNVSWKTTTTTTAGTTSTFDGAANTAAMVTAGIADHPAADFCVSLSIGGFTDWYLPAVLEVDIAYQNLKPTTASNSTSWGINNYSVPKRTANRTAGVPAQTSVAAFITGGSQAFATPSYHWNSTEVSASTGKSHRFSDGSQFNSTKTTGLPARAFRKVAL